MVGHYSGRGVLGRWSQNLSRYKGRDYLSGSKGQVQSPQNLPLILLSVRESWNAAWNEGIKSSLVRRVHCCDQMLNFADRKILKRPETTDLERLENMRRMRGIQD